MGCVSSKKARTRSPVYDVVITSARSSKKSGRLVPSGPIHVSPVEQAEAEKEVNLEEEKGRDFHEKSGDLVKGGESPEKAVLSIQSERRSADENHAAAGWPAWLSAVAGEAIDGWAPLRSDAYERLEKIGQGTYSTVYRARDLKTGKIVAVKKVRFDNFQPESVSFMTREILILRKLDHPNIMKLEGIIASRLSCSIYLVFEYMEHDLAGLLSCPDIKFTDSQIKCYMQQLLSGLEHCHSRGIMHRDIKSSNILVNNEGVLKIADFGLANFTRPMNKQPLTNRVVTLWYRPPELLLGSTNYAEAVDLWSVGCVFAELFIGRPLLKGRTEVEQLHKIFKLCGTPQDDYWKRSRLPLATMFKPQQPYESILRERCKEFPKSAVSLIETFLSFEPYKRGTASSCLNSEYFNTKPYACDPSSLPKYPPNKEIDAKVRDDARRKIVDSRAEFSSRNPRVQKTLQKSCDSSRVTPSEQEVEANGHRNRRSNNLYRRKGRPDSGKSLKQSYDTKSEASQVSQQSNGSSIRSLPPKKHKQEDVFTRLHNQPISRGQKLHATDPSSILQGNDVLGSNGRETEETSGRAYVFETVRRARRREMEQLRRPGSFDSSDVYESQVLPEEYGHKRKDRAAFSGPMISQIQEIPPTQYEQPHPHHYHRSRFYEGD